jgi:hypothetical protein
MVGESIDVRYSIGRAGQPPAKPVAVSLVIARSPELILYRLVHGDYSTRWIQETTVQRMNGSVPGGFTILEVSLVDQQQSQLVAAQKHFLTI